MPTVYDWRVRSRSFETLSIWGDSGIRPISQGQVGIIRGLAVNFDFFDMLGIKMLLGRTFTREDDQPNAPDKLILSYGLWRSQYGGNPDLVGRTVPTLRGSYTVIGVLPADFHPIHMSNPGEVPQLYTALRWDLSENRCRSCRGWRVMGRLKPGATVGQARAELNSIMRDLAREYPADYARDAAVVLMPLREKLMGRFDTALLILFGAVGLLLLLSIFLYRKKFGFGKSIISGAVTKYPGSAVLILYRKTFSAIVRLGRAELPTLSIKHPMFPAFFDPRVLRNREKTGPGDQTLAKSYDIGLEPLSPDIL